MKIKDYLKEDDLGTKIDKISGITNYDYFHKFFPNGRTFVKIYDKSTPDEDCPILRMAHDPDGIEFELEDKDGNLDSLVLEWDKDVKYVTDIKRIMGPSTMRICMMDEKYLEFIKINS